MALMPVLRDAGGTFDQARWIPPMLNIPVGPRLGSIMGVAVHVPSPKGVGVAAVGALLVVGIHVALSALISGRVDLVDALRWFFAPMVGATWAMMLVSNDHGPKLMRVLGLGVFVFAVVVISGSLLFELL